MSFSAPDFLTKLDCVIDKNIANEDFSIELLCQQLTISYTHTYRQIKELSGLSPSRYICKRRLACSLTLLQETDLSISEISYRVGFNSLPYFSRCFSQEYGCSPLRFRKMK